MFEKFKSSLTELNPAEMQAFYAEMHARLEKQYAGHVSWFDGPPACTCERTYHNGYIRSYKYLPTCKRCPDKSK
ncbi:hypothetical protein K2P56_00330 [Patescibacteria group bacterium]|nr:hypothetical protein [Patescibacteria group bacterium]